MAECVSDPGVPERADCLRGLADPARVVESAWALGTLRLKADGDDRGAPGALLRDPSRLTREYGPALASLDSELDRLIPAWVARFLEAIEKVRRWSEDLARALREGSRNPAGSEGAIKSKLELKFALQAVGERIDPHAGPIVAALGTLDRDCDEDLCESLLHAGPAILSAVAPVIRLLEERGVWRQPSGPLRVLARASQFDTGVSERIGLFLRSPEERTRVAGLLALQAIGPPARGLVPEIFALRARSEEERVCALVALGKLGSGTSDVLAALESALGDPNGYVRRAAAHAAGMLKAEPDRFVPLLVAACDWTEPLHDESLPEAAVAALGQYGPRGRLALPRMRRFLNGPIAERTVPAESVRRAIAAIDPADAAVLEQPSLKKRTAPLAPDEPLFAVRQNGRLCYIDREGAVALETRYHWGTLFVNDRAVVHDEDERTFVIDRSGRDVFASRWDELKCYSEGLAAIRAGDRWGFVDVEGKAVVEPAFAAVSDFSEGLAGFEVGRTVELRGDGFSWIRHGTRGFLDHEGQVVIPARWACATPFREGRSVVGLPGDEPAAHGIAHHGRKLGCIDRSGRLVIEARWGWIEPFSEGLAVVNQVLPTRDDELYGYIDLVGSEVIAPAYKMASAFAGGLALVRPPGEDWRGKTVLIDRANRVVSVLPCGFVDRFAEGRAVAWAGESYGYLDHDGAWIVEPQFDEGSDFWNGLARVSRGDWHGLIDHAGRFVWGPTTEPIPDWAPTAAWRD